MMSCRAMALCGEVLETGERVIWTRRPGGPVGLGVPGARR